MDPVDASRDKVVLRLEYEVARTTVFVAGNQQSNEDGVLLERSYRVNVALHRTEEVHGMNLVVVGRESAPS